MTECEQALHEIERYLDGELQPGTIRALEVHLEDCPPCAGRADFQRRIKVLIASKCSGDEVPESLRDKIDRMLRAERADG